jgi:hypothetical protein
MNGQFVRLMAIAALIAFNAAMVAISFVAGSSRDALLIGGWIPGNAVLCLGAVWATEHWRQSRHPH